MEEREEKRGGVGCLIGAVPVFFILLLLYVANAGQTGRVLPSGLWDDIYFPLAGIHRVSPPAGRMYDRYCNWCRGN